MLTKHDLTQIATLIHQEVQPITKKLDQHDQRFDSIDQRFDGIDQKFDGVDQKFDKIDQKFDKIDKHLNKHDKHFRKIDKDLEIIINYFDNNHLNHERRITHIESKLGIAQL